MKQKKNDNLHVVGGRKDPADAMIDELLIELNKEDGSIEDIEEKIRRHKKKVRTRVGVSAALIILAVVGTGLFIHLQTYTEARVIATYGGDGRGNNNYEQFAGGVLKYSRDGIAFLNAKGDDIWNQPYQLKSPMVDVYEKAAAVADKGGNDIIVFDNRGLKGEIHTTLPIEKISISGNGIVSAILKNETSPVIACYDAAGNLLAEVKPSLTGNGYPLDASLSEDGTVLLVSYLGVRDGAPMTKINYYNFGESGKEEKNYQVTSDDYENMIAPTTFHMGDSVSAVVGDSSIMIYKGAQIPKLQKEIPIKKQIKSVSHNSRYIAVVLKNEGKPGYELCLYNTAGKKVLSEDFIGDYNNIKVCGSQVILYEGKRCSIFTRDGVRKFDGELGDDIIEIYPIFGVNNYMVMNANGMEKVRFVK